MFSVRRSQRIQHARRDSNPQPTVLETATLPIELLAYKVFLLHFLLISSFSKNAQGNRPSARGRGRLLIQNFAHATGADGFAAFANSESNRLFHRDRGNQLDLNGNVIARHDHFDAIRQLNRPGHISGPEIKLRPVIGKKRGVTAALLLAQDIHFCLELLVRLNRARLGDDLTALNLFLLRAAQTHADVIAGARFVEKFAEHFDIGRGGFGSGTNADDLDFFHFLEHATLNTTGRDCATAFNVEHIFDWHQERLIDRPVWHWNVIVNRG